MKIRLPALLVGTLMASGCTGMPHQYLIEDAEIAREGYRMAVLDTCVARGLASGEAVADYRLAQQQLFSVSVHDPALYAARYAGNRKDLADGAGRSPASWRRLCETARTGLSEASAAMARQFAAAGGDPGAWRAVAVEQITALEQVTVARPQAWTPSRQ